ncbi:MAG: hypothetical protein Q9195_001488 [Heterodermia aff. obscurata]
MSVSGNIRQTRSRTAGSVAPSVAASAGDRSSPGSNTTSRKIRIPRVLDSYGSKGRAAVAKTFDHNVQPAMSARVLNPNDQFEQVDATETTGNDFVQHDLDGATARHTPAENSTRNPRQHPSNITANTAQAGPGKVAKKWLWYLALITFILACVAGFTYRSALLTGLDGTMRTGRQIQELFKGQESLTQFVDRNDEEIRQLKACHEENMEKHRHRMDIIEQKLLNLPDDYEEFSIFRGKPSVDWFHPSNKAVVISKYTSPEKMRKVGGWLGLFKKKVAFNAVPDIVGPFADVKKMWCAPSDRGQAQITILLAEKIIPNILIVEQADSKDTTPYWQTFPDQIEFWASFDEDAPEPIITFVPSWVSGATNQGRELTDVQALPSSFKMLGRWNYELRNSHLKQAFHISVTQPTNLVSFRVNSNHGDADQMCLHKLRLYGNPVQPQPRVSKTTFQASRESFPDFL